VSAFAETEAATRTAAISIIIFFINKLSF